MGPHVGEMMPIEILASQVVLFEFQRIIRQQQRALRLLSLPKQTFN
jgi:hypothetical protein